MITDITQANSPEFCISGVIFKDLKSFPDDRGFFRELVRETDDFFKEGFGQWSHSKMGKNTVKAWHYHHEQVDWWYLPFGVINTVLYDNREESPTYKRKMEFKMGDVDVDPEALTTVVKIPQGVLHGCKVLTETAHLFYITSKTYNPDDEGRFRFDSELVPHNWGNPNELIIAERDKKDFVPTSPRTQLK
jgi:dTDP-4-dehydrorhamnose 3,5-epimerase